MKVWHIMSMYIKQYCIFIKLLLVIASQLRLLILNWKKNSVLLKIYTFNFV